MAEVWHVISQLWACRWRNIEIEEKKVQMIDITKYINLSPVFKFTMPYLVLTFMLAW